MSGRKQLSIFDAMSGPALGIAIDGPGTIWQQADIDSRVVLAAAMFCGKWRGQSAVHMQRLERGVACWAFNDHAGVIAMDPGGELEQNLQLVFTTKDLAALAPLKTKNTRRSFVLEEDGLVKAVTRRTLANGTTDRSDKLLGAMLPHDSYAPPALLALAEAVRISDDRAAGRSEDLALKNFCVRPELMTLGLEVFSLFGAVEHDGVSIEGCEQGPVVLSSPNVHCWVVLMPRRRSLPQPAPDWVREVLEPALAG